MWLLQLVIICCWTLQLAGVSGQTAVSLVGIRMAFSTDTDTVAAKHALVQPVSLSNVSQGYSVCQQKPTFKVCVPSKRNVSSSKMYLTKTAQ